jgi:hypothetical protein
MRRYAQLTADEQTAAVQLALNGLGVDDTLLSDPVVRPKLDALAQRRAKAAFYIDPGDQLITLPPGPLPPTP